MLQIVIYKKLNFWEEYTPLHEGRYRELQGQLKIHAVGRWAGTVQESLWLLHLPLPLALLAFRFV